MTKISATFDISPATATTCGDGSGAFCRHCSLVPGKNGLLLHGAWPLRCAVFDKELTTDTGDERGWVQRLPECVAAEGIREPTRREFLRQADEMSEEFCRRCDQLKGEGGLDDNAAEAERPEEGK